MVKSESILPGSDTADTPQPAVEIQDPFDHHVSVTPDLPEPPMDLFQSVPTEHLGSAEPHLEQLKDFDHRESLGALVDLQAQEPIEDPEMVLPEPPLDLVDMHLSADLSEPRADLETAKNKAGPECLPVSYTHLTLPTKA